MNAIKSFIILKKIDILTSGRYETSPTFETTSLPAIGSDISDFANSKIVDTAALECEIDVLVYALDGLTEDEIAVVEA